MERLTELLDLPADKTERTLCKLVTDKTVYARIDRPKGIVTFKPKQTNYQVLNSWSTDIGKILNLVEKTSHLVSKVRRAPTGVHVLTRRNTQCKKQLQGRRFNRPGARRSPRPEHG
jgi:hypothetical protein